MKHIFTLSLFLLALSSTFAQVVPFEPQVDWYDPTYTAKQVKENRIKTIRISSYEVKPQQRGNSFQSGVFYRYNSDGQLLHTVKTVKSVHDTAEVQAYEYSQRGVLCWQETIDRRWQRTYRSGYRFNGHGKPYQVKSYEILQNQERMLLKSRQYIYDDDSTLQAIRLLENHQIVRVHEFAYLSDQPALVGREVIKDGDDNVVKQVTYAYNEHSLIAHVVMTEAYGDRSEYRYHYNEQNQPTRIEWWQGEKLIGLVLYEYSQQGLVTHLNQTLYPNTPQQHSRYKVFEYEIDRGTEKFVQAALD